MKKILSIYITALAALLAVSCTQEFQPDTQRATADGETSLVMRVRSTAPETRMVPSIAEEDLNEFVLEHYYYFIYKNNPAETAGEVPVFVGKWIAPEGTKVVGTGTEEKVPLDKLTALASADGNTYSGYVYVIANYKDATYAAALDAIVNAETPDYSTLTWTYLQNLPLPATFQSYNIVSGAQIMNEKQDQGHRFKPQDSFVMASVPASFSVTKGTAGSIDAPLKRLAAKVSLEIHLAKWFVQRNNGAYKYTWYSDAERFQAYLRFAADKGKMDGTPITYDNASDFFNYRRFAFVQDGVNAEGTYTPADGKYAEKEPLKWVYKVDADPAAQPEEEDGKDIYYAADEDLVGKIVEVDGAIQYYKYERPAYLITGTPFYSYPYDFSGDSGHAPFFKIIVEWTAYKESRIATETTEGGKGTPEVISREFYYKITLPEIKLFQANKWYKLRVDLATLGSEADEAAIDVASDTYFVTDWSDPTDPDVPEINAGRYLNVTSPEKAEDESLLFTMYGSKPLEIPVVSSHAIEVVNVTSSYMNFYTGNTASLTRSTTSATGNNFKIETAPDNSSVTLSHTLVTTLADMNPRDVAKITYKFRIKHTGAEGSTYYKDITVVQLPPMYIEADPNSGYDDRRNSQGQASTYGDYRSGYAFVNTTTYQFGDNWYNTSGLYNSANTNRNMYVVTTSVASPGKVIGDPRTPATNIITDFTGNASANGWVTAPALDGTSPRKLSAGYLQAESGSRTLNMIAPIIRIASSFGATQPFNFNYATRRCAGYQEDGRPAGRWRLPTAAEIEFLVNLSAQNLLPRLFGGATGNTNYWSANGYCTVNNADNKVTPHTGNNAFSGSCYTRCVYDEWYWGSETLSDRTVFTWGDEYSAN